ncbi:MAG TPA: hypothetical protein PKB15_06880 [Acidimicrobiia bacterium]|nr:hypothetical protein [Acidimicrobiia bacterium]
MEDIQREDTETTDANEEGMTTAELLGNAALAIAALVGIWLLLQQIGVDVMNYIRTQIGV